MNSLDADETEHRYNCARMSSNPYTSPEGETTSPPVGRAPLWSRLGVVPIVLGSLLTARIVWLVAVNGGSFTMPDWNRTTILLWLGQMLVLLGCGLAYRAWLPLVMAGLMIVGPIFAGVLIELGLF